MLFTPAPAQEESLTLMVEELQGSCGGKRTATTEAAVISEAPT